MVIAGLPFLNKTIYPREQNVAHRRDGHQGRRPLREAEHQKGLTSPGSASPLARHTAGVGGQASAAASRRSAQRGDAEAQRGLQRGLRHRQPRAARGHQGLAYHGTPSSPSACAADSGGRQWAAV